MPRKKATESNDQKKSNYVKIVTVTTPAAIPIKQAANMIDRGENQISNDIEKGKLNYGYVFDESTIEDPTNRGQKVIVMDSKWETYAAMKGVKRKYQYRSDKEIKS